MWMRCIEAYDDDQGGYTVEYHQETYGGRAMGRLWASCGMQSLYKPFQGVIANLMGLVDWDMRNAHQEILLQLFGSHGVPSKLINDYVSNRDAWYALVLDQVNGDPAHRANPGAKEFTREDAKKLFIRLLYQGSSGPWYKEHHFESNIRKV